MGMIGMGNECYLYVNGISVSKPIWLHDTVCISPAKSAIKWKEVMPLFENDIDFSIAVLCNPTIASQLHIIGDDTEHLIAKDKLESAVEESANLLTRILRRCAELNKLPDVDNLAFRVDKQKQGIKCKMLVP